MNKKLISKNLLSLAIIMFLMLPVFAVAHTASAQKILDIGISEVNNTIQLSQDDPRKIVGRLINTAMLFLGIIAVVIILLAGFKWMTAGGNDDKVSEAKKLMGAGVIGLVIILAAWGIATFVLNALVNATNTTVKPYS